MCYDVRHLPQPWFLNIIILSLVPRWYKGNMGSKASTPHTPDSEDSSTTSQAYSRAERVSDHEQSARQARQERSFMERAESSLHGLLYSNGPGVDIRRSNGDQHPSYGSSPVRPGSGSIPSAGPNRSYSMGGGAGPESVGSSSGSTGLSHFLSNFNLWRASVPGSGGGDRQRAQSLSHVPPDPHSSSSTSSSSSAAAAQAADSSSSRSRSHYSEQSDDLSSLVVNPRAALARLLSSSGRDGRNGAGTTRDNNGGTTFSVRDLTFAAAQEFLAEATMNGAGRVYVTHSLPSHMWAVNGNWLKVFFFSFSTFDDIARISTPPGG